MSLNVLCQLDFTKPNATVMRGATGESVVSGTYYGDFTILTVGQLEWVDRRPPGLPVADCELIIDNTGGSFERALGDTVWGLAAIRLWVGRGRDFQTGYARLTNATSPGMHWAGRVLLEDGLVALPGERFLLRASSSLFADDLGVLGHGTHDNVDTADGFSVPIPLVMGNWQDQRGLLPTQCPPSILTGYGGDEGDGGDWQVCLGPVESLHQFFKEGADPTDRDNAHRRDRFDITGFVTDTNTDVVGAYFSLGGRSGSPAALLGYTPEGVWVKMKGLKTTATHGVPGLAANTFIDRARDEVLWFILHRLNIAAADINTASFAALPAYSGRRYLPIQQQARNIVEELEHDLGFQAVWLSGARGAGSAGQLLYAVRLGRGRILTDWLAARYFVDHGHTEVIRTPGYANVFESTYNFSASFGPAGAKGFSQGANALAQGQLGSTIRRQSEYRWLYEAADVSAQEGLLLAHWDDWPIVPVQFFATTDYLDILPTDRLVLDPDQDTNAQGTRYVHVEEVALDWEHQLLRISGYKGARQAA